MSAGLNGEDTVDLTCAVGGLQVSIRGPAAKATELLQKILRANSLEKPALCSTVGAYWRIIGELATSDSVSHSFPSELEAKAYIAGAGITEFDTVA